MKKIVSVLLLVFFFSSLAFAHGKSDIEEIQVENLNSWQEEFDLEGKKPGKYNIKVTARDLGGNVYVEGPYNIDLDPKSDLPVSGITNPYPNMRVVGNLNIVGTCVDDDGVSKVELILDEGLSSEKHVVAEGKEFWSYYLETVNLEEGQHTIKVIGYDINNTPVEGKPATVVWQLDRKQPVSLVENHDMGVLVSKTATFDGVVSDGNKIDKLEYSIDSCEHFTEVKIKKNQADIEFSISLDTRKSEDGPQVLWLRARDMAGSVGLYSFLYFVDNTQPDVAIVSPTDEQVVNGKFTVAGYAKDKIGVSELTWEFGEETGVIELIPGNPYFTVTVDTIGAKEKNRKFIVHAIDRAGNKTDYTKVINLNQEDDKPVVTPASPSAGQVYFAEDNLFVRGFVTDDDGVQSVKIQLDANEPVIFETRGAYYYELCQGTELETGKHKVTITGIDVNGVEGNPNVTEIVSMGLSATFENPSIIVGKEKTPFEMGMNIHPESGSAFGISVKSSVGLKNVHSELKCGSSGLVEQDINLKNVPSYEVNLPLPNTSPKGVVYLTIKATDVVDRVTEYKSVLFITNNSVISVDDPVVIFDDSTVAEDGGIVSNFEFPASGYVLGGKPEKVELVPNTPFAKAEIVGNQIQIIPQNEVGTSQKFVVQVTTDKGKVVKSKELYIKNDTAYPELNLADVSDSMAIDGRNGSVEISGNASCATGLGSVKYRVLGVKTDIQKSIIASAKADPIPEDFQDVTVESSGNFKINLNSSSWDYGIYVVEVIAESLGGNATAKSFAVSNIPDIEPINDKMPSPAAPKVVFLDAFDVYAVAAYQGNVDKNFQAFNRSEMNEGNNPLIMETTTEEGKLVSGKYTAVKAPSLNANIALVNGETYYSGMPVVIPYATKAAATLTVYIDTSVSVNSLSYEITGDEAPGGDLKQTGNAKLIKPTEENPGRWTAEIPLGNLPSRVTKVSMKVKAGTLEKELWGILSVVRENESEKIDDEEKCYEIPDADVIYVEENDAYYLANNSSYNFFANYKLPIKAELVGGGEGLSLSVKDNIISISPQKDGLYKNVYVKFTDRFGDSYETKKLNFIVDSNDPIVKLEKPEIKQWLGNEVLLQGTAADTLGILSVEYSFDNGETWNPLEFKLPANSAKADIASLGVTFSQTIPINDLPDGLIQIDIRATDNSSRTSEFRTACFKDTTPPDVKVIEPLSIDMINGETLIVFEAKDNGMLASADYITPPVKDTVQQKYPVELAPLVSTYVGTKQCPNEEAMSFQFTDEAGNVATVESWDFVIDNESDLPVTEIQVPQEMQIITRDMVVSGVVYDDDGDSTIYYKLDDGEYIKYPQQGTSFAIAIPLYYLTDNEHTVTLYSVDINGVKGHETTRTFRVSLEEPKGAVELPTIDTTVREMVTFSGWSSDKNGIAKVEISLDNGNSYNDVVGTENWTYEVDSRAIPDGTQVVFLKVTDGYGIQGLYSSLVNIDNTVPKLNLELPLDDTVTTGELFFSGSTYDNVNITDLHITIRNLEKPNEVEVIPMNIDMIIGQAIDMKNFSNGFYNVEVTAKDKAGNETSVCRNIHLDKDKPNATVNLLYPMNGEHKQGLFTIYGESSSETEIRALKLYVDGNFVEETQITECGYFKFDMSPEKITDGNHTYHVDAVLPTGVQVSSRDQTIIYQSVGPWITIDNFTYGDFAINRPYLRGQAGYSLSEDELLLSKTKEASPELKKAVSEKRVAKVEISFDNGKTFQQISKTEKWMYRIENQDMVAGYHFLIVRATMINGEVAITRSIIQIDNQVPTVKLIAPNVGGKYNQRLNVSGLSNDDVKLEDVTLTLRKGDKSSYEVPSFIQGLYLDFHFWGATLFDIGLGLTAFDDVVKIQVSWGQFTQYQRNAASDIFELPQTSLRFGGDNIWSFKLLANIYSLPFSYMFGHDWDWLYAEVALGAEFARFNQTNSNKEQILSALLAQIEFPKVKLPNTKAFSTFSFYTEGSLWFISTDVSSSVNIENKVFQIAFGARVNIF